MPNQILVGTGFYSTKEMHQSKVDFLYAFWLPQICGLRHVVVDNSECGLECLPHSVPIDVRGNAGYAGLTHKQCAGPILGWAVSWIIPALIAYSEKCDFVYKEQDCLAFGDWLDVIRVGRMSFGRNSQMGCEQSLFFIRQDFIPEAIRLYMNIREHEVEFSTEAKFLRMMEQDNGIVFHDLPGGRDRPIPATSKAFYLQRITPEEMQLLKEVNLI